MHESQYVQISSGAANARRRFQGASLFGLESFPGPSGPVLRKHGYSAGRIQFRGTTGELTLWPREGRKLQDGTWGIVPDLSFRLPNRLHTEPAHIQLLSPTGTDETLSGAYYQSQLTAIRKELLADVATEELRKALARLDDLLSTVSEQRPASVQTMLELSHLKEDIISSIGREQPLTGFRSERDQRAP